ncbi:Hypothetical predicted protein [Olea europaea subsp. europaea]|uniref:GAG-pre-integrase domain-containing protein n=1 Tax=Olea europaea subsp. europaea TaxID=158383 RepID=A0A8S0RHL7_OLEEU|nr:Hypothetical predicted protein [Olea europaea subsp. europaea]
MKELIQAMCQDLNSSKMIGRGKRVDGLDIINTALGALKGCNVRESICNSTYNVVNNSRIWHSRFGHLSFKRLEHLKGQLHFKTDKRMDDVPCFVSPLAKQRRLSFVSHNHLSSNVFDLVHRGIWDSYSSPTRNGHRLKLRLTMNISYETSGDILLFYI